MIIAQSKNNKYQVISLSQRAKLPEVVEKLCFG